AEPAAAPQYVTVIDVVPPGSAGATSNEANPYGALGSRCADQEAGSVSMTDRRWTSGLPGSTPAITMASRAPCGRLAGTEYGWAPPRVVRCTVPCLVSMSWGPRRPAGRATRAGVSRELPATAPRTGCERS